MQFAQPHTCTHRERRDRCTERGERGERGAPREAREAREARRERRAERGKRGAPPADGAQSSKKLSHLLSVPIAQLVRARRGVFFNTVLSSNPGQVKRFLKLIDLNAGIFALNLNTGFFDLKL